MDILTIERIRRHIYKVSYNGVCVDVPWFRIESAIKRVMRHYHEVLGVGR